MEKNHAFLDPELTLSGLARLVRTNRTYLSNFFNHELGTTFYAYLNDYRVAYAVKLLLTTNLTLEVVAERAGFRSISTFRRNFELRYGCSASAYRRRHRDEERQAQD